MKDEATPEQLEMARRIAANECAAASWKRAIALGEMDDWHGVKIALSAIIATTELAAKMLDNSARVAGERSIAADREDKPDSARNWTAAMVTAENAAKAIRAGKHYGKDQQ